ncbi:molybdopterin molybdenumtransferase MoeA [Oceanobacillus sp. 143]|nr:gephyrin-like molybdotransferase Glp [Oceanobacillus zhaokaii]QGS69376.1 molybdopterin molybdenumtransferase MoeA [Oceanobacillus sp. 143]
MVEIRKAIHVNEAICRVMSSAITGPKTYVAIEDSLSYYLGEDLLADHDVPAFDRSPYDGFAIRAEDTLDAGKGYPIRLEVIGEIGAGSVHEGEVQANQAVRIMTGAQIPNGCNAVIMLEHVEMLEHDWKTFIQIDRRLTTGENITRTGEDTRQGETLVKKGTYINPGVMALLATCGYKQVPVIQKPKVGIISTGSELLAVDAALEPGKIRDSNSYMLLGQIERAGGIPLLLGQFKDDFTLCYNQVVDALDKVDILLTTGGVSVGDYDYIPAILDKLKARVLFNKVRMRPGSVTTVAEIKGKLLFGLSGNPSSCYVGFELFTRPVIRTYLQSNYPFMRRVVVQLGAAFTRPNPFDRFVRGKLQYENGQTIAMPVGLDKPNIVTSLAEADILIMLPGGAEVYEKEMEVTAILLEDQTGTTMDSFISKQVIH